MMKLGEQVKLVKEPIEAWQKFVDKCNNRNEEIKKRENGKITSAKRG